MPPFDIEIVTDDGYRPDQSIVRPGEFPRSIYRGLNFWHRPNGRNESWGGVSDTGIVVDAGDVIHAVDSLYATQSDGNSVRYRAGAIFSIGQQPTGRPNSGIVRVNGNTLADVTSFAVNGATNATPIVITTATPHGFATGQYVFIAGVGGNTAANNFWQITVTGATTFALNGSVGNGAYTAGGVVWKVMGIRSRLQCAIPLGLDSNGVEQYAVRDAGLSAPVTPSAAATAAASRMAGGYYTAVVIAKSSVTGGRSNPSAPTASVSITAATDKFRLTLPAAVPNGADTWVIGVTKAGAAAADPTKGPWYELLTEYPVASHAAGTTIDLEWTDAELTRLASFDNNPPPPGLFVDALDDILVVIGTYGKASGRVSVTNGNATVTYSSGDAFDEGWAGEPIRINGVDYTISSVNLSGSTKTLTLSTVYAGSTATVPFVFYKAAGGPVVSASLPGNPEAFPITAQSFTQNQESIVGKVAGKGQIYLLCTNSLQVAVRTGSDTAPMRVFPLWQFGFSNPYAGVVAQGLFYGFTQKGAARSRDLGDPDLQFAADVGVQMSSWNPAKVRLVYDPKNAAVLFCHSEDPTPETSTVLAFMLQTEKWSAPFIIQSDSLIPALNGSVSGLSRIDGDVLLVAASNSGSALTVTGATNASPIVVTTSAAHGLVTGQYVNIQNVLGNTATNGNWVVTKLSSTTFSLNGSTGNGAYTSGGTAKAMTGRIYQWDNGDQVLPCYLATPFFDGGSDNDKFVNTLQITGNVNNGNVAIYKDLDLAGLVAGTNPVFVQNLTSSGLAQHYRVSRIRTPHCKSIAVRVTAGGEDNEINKINLRGEVVEVRR